jgi:hypothetical protein
MWYKAILLGSFHSPRRAHRVATDRTVVHPQPVTVGLALWMPKWRT